jgi:D-tyrosyl-tRNA(Tyr) deacylase
VRALLQRVSQATVVVVDCNGRRDTSGSIGAGLCALVGVTHDDTPETARRLAAKLWNLRIFPDAAGAMNLSVGEGGGEVLVVSQFTLYGDTSKGRRPSFVGAAPPEQAEPLVEALVEELRSLGATVATGRFRTHMEVTLTNDGPVTVLVEVAGG